MPGRPLVPRLPRDAWVVLGGDALSAIGSGLTLPFFLVYLSRIRDIDIAVAGLAVATIAIAGLVGNPVGGALTDRIGAKRALVAGLVVAAAGAFLVILVREPWQAFAVAAIVGFGAAVIWPAQDALLAVVVSPDQRSSVFAVRNLTLNAGYAIGALLASLIVDLSSPLRFELLYLIDGLTFLAFIPILVLLLPGFGGPAGRVEPRPEDGSWPNDGARPSGYRAVLRDRTFLRVWVLFAVLVTIGFSQTLSGFPGFSTTIGGIDAAGLSVAFAANTLTVLIAQLPVLRLMEGHRRTTGIVLACLCWAIAWAITLLAGWTGSQAVVWFAVALAVFGLGETLLAPSQAALVNDLAADDLRGRYNGLYALSWTTGMAIGPALAGVMLGAGYGYLLFVVLIVGCAIAATGATFLARRLPADANLVTFGPAEPRRRRAADVGRAEAP
jgi:MFS family permease